MKISIFKEKENPYMKRKEVVASVEHTTGATPSRASLQQTLAQEWNVAPEQVDVKGIFTRVGKQASRIKIHVWQEAKVPDLSKQPKEEKKAEAAPAAAPAAVEKK
jgi:ribosomal protein S24E